MKTIFNKRTEYHVGMVMFKYFPVVGTILMTLLVGVLLMTPNNVNIEIENNIAGNSMMGITVIMYTLFTTLLLCLSDILGFCALHKAMLVYMTIVGGCVGYEHFVGFGKFLLPSRITVFALGCIILLTLTCKWKSFKNCYGKK